MALINDKIKEAFQIRIAHEEANVKRYRAMGNYLNLNGYENASKLWYKHAEEESTHRQWAVQFLLDMNELPDEPEQESPQTEFKGLPQIIALTYKFELQTTNECKELAKLCFEEGDFMAFNVALRFTNEQIEEMAVAQLLVDQLNSFGDDKIAMRLLDNWIGEELLG